MGKKTATEDFNVLFEHSAGYAIFKVKEFEEIALLLPQVMSGHSDLGRLNSVIKLVSFTPFTSAINALDNINAVSEGVLHDDLKTILSTFLPYVKHHHNVLGVADHRLASAISDELPIRCVTSEAVNETIRGIRLFFTKFVEKVNPHVETRSQLGLSHSYSRSKVKFNVNRTDTMIIQSVCLLEQLDKNINTFYMRIKEWYSYHYPELTSIITDPFKYVQIASIVGDRNSFNVSDEDIRTKITQVTQDDDLTEQIYKTSQYSMGVELSPIDIENLNLFTGEVAALCAYRKNLQQYLDRKMSLTAPNLAEVVGSSLGARLISHSGSLTNLAKHPSSTIQIMGAENALFKAIKTKGKTPKYGHIFHSTFIGRAAPSDKGKVARILANKCSIASRIDSFSDLPTNVFGKKLRQQLEDRLEFFSGGEFPRANIEVMEEACVEANKMRQEMGDDGLKVDKSNDSTEQISKKVKKSKKRRENSELNSNSNKMTKSDVSFTST